MFEMLTSSVAYIGTDDADLDLFESQYKLNHGVSYNSYVVFSDKTAILDTADARKTDEWLDNLNEALAGRTPDYLVISHMEPDHAASIQALLDKYPQITLVGNALTFGMLPKFFPALASAKKEIVKEGQTLSLGSLDLQFYMAPMVHWPEVMVTYLPQEKILFSADGFGKFGTRAYDEPWDDEARRYYCNIVGKFGPQVQALLKKAAKLDIQMICPLHGPILKEDLGHYINLYDLWSKYEPETDGVLILCASIYGNTMKAAQALKDILEAKGQKVKLMDVTREDVHEAAAQCFRYSKAVFAASSYDAGVFPPMERLLHILQHKNWQNRKVGLMENGTWAPSANRTMLALLDGMKNVEVVQPMVTIQSAYKEKDEAALAGLADAMA